MFYLCENNAGILTLFVDDFNGSVEWCHTYNDHKNPEHDCAVDMIHCAFAEFDIDIEGNEIDSFIDSDMNPEDYGDIVFSSAWNEYQHGIWYAFDNYGTAGKMVRNEIERLLNAII